ncbi:hypothetical protein B0H19DRAFT_1143168 [Mycena capillaripes]|nr:hypothetical protein B0H19DRAFT_1143168 [Mycena capillaripes]
MQKTILPIFEVDLPVPPGELFSTWSTLAESYGDNATQVATDCRALLETFQKQVDTLKSNLNAVKTRIAADKEELAAAQRAYDDLKAQMLVDGILAIVLTAGAIAAAYSGQGELIGELGGKAGETLSQVVEDDIKAGEIKLLIRKIERIIAIAENTSNELDKAIPLVVDVVNSMTQIGNVWADINGNLTIANNGYDSWKDADLLTPYLLNTLASRWASYETEAVRYVDRILGIQTPTTVNLLSISLSGVSEKELKATKFGTESASDSHALRKFYQISNDPQLRSFMAPKTTEARIEKFNVLYAKALDDQFYNAIKAPSITIDTNRQNFNNSAAQYRQAADILQSLFPQDANNLRDLASRIDSEVIPPITECVNFYKTFANAQVSALSVAPTKAGLEALAAENARLSAEGMQKASTAQTKVLDFKNSSVLVNTSLIQRSNELQLTMSGVQRELAEKRAEMAKYQGIEWMPGIGALIKLIIEAITHNEERMRELLNKMGGLNQAMRQVSAARGVEEAALNSIVSLTQSWANLTQEAKDLGAYLKLISEVPDTASALAEEATKTWNDLNTNLARW